MKWINNLPQKSGKYIVKTKTSMGRINVFDSIFNADTNKWSFTNQKFISYIDEEI